MTFLKSSILISISTLVGILVGLVSQKLYGIYLGPVGLAYLGNFINLVNIYTLVTSAGQQSGLVASTATHSTSPDGLYRHVSTILTFGLLLSGVGAVFLILFSASLSAQFLAGTDYTYVFILLGISGFLLGQNILFMSILNGLKAMKLYVISQISMHAINLVLKLTLVVEFGLGGALVSIFLPNVLSILVTFYLLRKDNLIDFSRLKFNIDRLLLKPMLEYLFMAVISFALLQLTQLIIRGLVIDKIGQLEAGYWQAVLTISGIYISFAGASINTYYLPKMAPLTSRSDLLHEVHHMLRLLVPLLLFCLSGLYVFRNLGLRLLFSNDFVPAEKLFLPFLLGDFFRIVSWLYAFMLIAKKRTLLYAFTELGFALFWILGSVWSVQYYGIMGVTWVYAAVYFIYLAVLIALFYFTPLLIPPPHYEGADTRRL